MASHPDLGICKTLDCKFHCFEIDNFVGVKKAFWWDPVSATGNNFWFNFALSMKTVNTAAFTRLLSSDVYCRILGQLISITGSDGPLTEITKLCWENKSYKSNDVVSLLKAAIEPCLQPQKERLGQTKRAFGQDRVQNEGNTGEYVVETCTLLQ